MDDTPTGADPAPSPGAAPDDAAFLAALRTGDEPAFTRLVERYHGSLLRTVLAYVRDREVAEEVVQETWIAVAPEGVPPDVLDRLLVALPQAAGPLKGQAGRRNTYPTPRTVWR